MMVEDTDLGDEMLCFLLIWGFVDLSITHICVKFLRILYNAFG